MSGKSQAPQLPWRVLPAHTHRVMPWKNGGGVTTELCVEPAGAGLEEFEWRLSMARIDVPGPFSRFPGIDRILAVLEGRVRLRMEGREPFERSGSDAPLSFPGESEVHADPLDGPVLDLNLMVRRGRCTGSIERCGVDTDLGCPSGEVLLLLSRNRGLRWVLHPDASTAGGAAGQDVVGQLDRADALCVGPPMPASEARITLSRVDPGQPAFAVRIRRPD